MTIRSFLCLALTLLATGAATAKEIVRIPAPEGVLPVVVTEPLGNGGNAYSDFERLDEAFQRVVKERNWPLKIAAERIGGGVPDYLTEVRISLQRIRQDIPGEYRYRAWTLLMIDGKKHDLGIVFASYDYRLGEPMEDVLDKAFLAGANVTADKLEPLLFPDLKTKKK